MARDFNGSNQELITASTTFPGGPCTVAFWLYNDTTQASWSFVMDDGVDKISSHTPWSDGIVYWDYPNISNGRVSTAWGARNGQWVHVGLTSNGVNAREIYFDGVSQATATASVTAPNITDTLAIGSGGGLEYQDGRTAEFAMWTAKLSADEIGVLAKKFSPLFVNPTNLFAYFPLIGRTSPEIELISGLNATVTGATTIEHPAIIYPTQPMSGFVVAAAPPAGLIIPVAMNSYRQSHQSIV